MTDWADEIVKNYPKWVQPDAANALRKAKDDATKAKGMREGVPKGMIMLSSMAAQTPTFVMADKITMIETHFDYVTSPPTINGSFVYFDWFNREVTETPEEILEMMWEAMKDV